MAGLTPHPAPLLAAAYLLTTALIVSGIVGAHAFMRNRTLEQVIARVHPAAIVMIWSAMAFAVIIEQGTGDAFIYFQF
jgi:alginate O-acetyltransferase complex protein AlgI